MQKKDKLAIIVAGGNGAGKSTFINHQLLSEYKNIPIKYINADDWQKQTFGEFDNTTDTQAKQAQEWADKEREKHLATGQSFITETVFSHPSKIDLIKQAKGQGFQVNLYHISLDNAEMALDRINERVLLGGHDVDADKVKNRYDRIKDIITEATKYADKTFVYDNSVMYRPHEKILTLDKENIISIHNHLPSWVTQTYKQSLDKFHDNLKAKLPEQQKESFNHLEAVIREKFKDNPVQLNEKINILNEKLLELVNSNISLNHDDLKDKEKGR